MRFDVRLLAILGRVLVSLNFIVLGISSIYYFELVKSDLARALTSLELHTNHWTEIAEFVNKLSANVTPLLCLGIFLQIFGGMLVFFGYRLKLGVFFLLVYLIPASIIAHHFWFLTGSEFARSLVLFLFDLSTIGALFLIAASDGGMPYRRPRTKIKESGFDHSHYEDPSR